ncbi:MAG TPA: hypothetical protein VNX25_02775, partial [Verrucomicrobiae bacterium]|nr:hypothetical protein [Verrucomicrobiae bacterium]
MQQAVPGEKRAPETLYRNTNLFFINLLTRLVPRGGIPPFAFLTGFLVYLILPRVRRGVRANLRVITGRRNVERLVISTYYRYSRIWPDIMLMARLR